MLAKLTNGRCLPNDKAMKLDEIPMAESAKTSTSVQGVPINLYRRFFKEKKKLFDSVFLFLACLFNWINL